MIGDLGGKSNQGHQISLIWLSKLVGCLVILNENATKVTEADGFSGRSLYIHFVHKKTPSREPSSISVYLLQPMFCAVIRVNRGRRRSQERN